MYTFKITYIFIIYNLIFFFSYISISVHSTLFNLWGFFLYWCYIASLLCYSYACLYYHACLHYVNKKWSDKDTDCTCCVYSILKCLHSWNHKNLSFPWIYDMKKIIIINFFFLTTLPCHTTRRPAVPPGVRWILQIYNIINFDMNISHFWHNTMVPCYYSKSMAATWWWFVDLKAFRLYLCTLFCLLCWIQSDLHTGSHSAV